MPAPTAVNHSLAAGKLSSWCGHHGCLRTFRTLTQTSPNRGEFGHAGNTPAMALAGHSVKQVIKVRFVATRRALRETAEDLCNILSYRFFIGRTGSCGLMRIKIFQTQTAGRHKLRDDPYRFVLVHQIPR